MLECWGKLAMLRSGKRIRFTRSEVDEFRRIGVDLTGVKTEADLEAVFTFLANTLADERPDLLEKIARGLAEAKGLLLVFSVALMMEWGEIGAVLSVPVGIIYLVMAAILRANARIWRTAQVYRAIDLEAKRVNGPCRWMH